jgi:hypothetical protein
MPLGNRLALLMVWLIVAPLGAQYNPPGTSVAGVDVTEEEELRSSLEDASWQLGALRLQPWIGIRDASLVTSSEDDQTDVTASAGAGLRAYVKTGPKVIWAAHGLPEYVWWQDDAARRRLNGRYGLGLFAYFNRLDLELSARRNETQSFFSSEVQELTTTRHDVARLGFELELAERVFLFGALAHAEDENQEDERTVFSLLDQRIDTRRAGLRYRTPRGFSIGAGWEETENDFDSDARNLSHTGEAALFETGYEGRRFNAAFVLEGRRLTGREGSEFADLETTTGYLETSWNLHRAVDLLVYGRRQVGFSIRNEFASVVAERAGTRLDLRFRGSTLFLAAETGKDDFQATVPGSPERSDDVLAFGLGINFQVKQAFRLSTGLVRTEYDSNVPGFDRAVTAWTASVQLGVFSDKLDLGDGDRTW